MPKKTVTGKIYMTTKVMGIPLPKKQAAFDLEIKGVKHDLEMLLLKSGFTPVDKSFTVPDIHSPGTVNGKCYVWTVSMAGEKNHA